MNKLFAKYQEFIVNSNPNPIWVKARFLLHWITIPLKLILIGLLGIYGIIYNRVKYKKREPQARNLKPIEKVQRLQRILKFLPVLKNEKFDLYLPRNKMGDPLNGSNNNTDHQLLHQGRYVFLMSKLNRRTHQMDTALSQFMQGKYLARGYSWDFVENKFNMNFRSTSGDMLIGLCMAMLGTSQTDESQAILMEKFDILVSSIIENDYSLLEGSEPTDEPYKTIYQKKLKESDQRPELVRMKSSRAMWNPGLECVGAQALTLLCALKVNAEKNKSRESEKEYWNMFYKHGYALLSLLPTAYLPNRRGYFNDSNCIQALYVLLKLSKTKTEKLVYKFALRYIFNLSKSWYNLYFIGLIKEVAPELIDKNYLEEAKKYLYEEDPIVWTLVDNAQQTVYTVPVPLGLLSHSEFAYSSSLDRIAVAGTGSRVLTGLSELAAMALLEDDISEIFNNPKLLN